MTEVTATVAGSMSPAPNWRTGVGAHGDCCHEDGVPTVNEVHRTQGPRARDAPYEEDQCTCSLDAVGRPLLTA